MRFAGFGDSWFINTIPVVLELNHFGDVRENDMLVDSTGFEKA
jgi:hypothetical protein